jgi:hypothetical protein
MCGGFHSSRVPSTPTLGLFNRVTVFTQPRDGTLQDVEVFAQFPAPIGARQKKATPPAGDGSGTLNTQLGEFFDGGERDEQQDYYAAGAVDV